jgi:hypothetical protein
MSSLTEMRNVTATEREELAAQRIACTFLVKGCENALFCLGTSAADIGDSDEARIDRRATVVMQEILGSWRATLDILRGLELKESWPDVESFEGWLHLDPALSDAAIAAAAARYHFQA